MSRNWPASMPGWIATSSASLAWPPPTPATTGCWPSSATWSP